MQFRLNSVCSSSRAPAWYLSSYLGLMLVQCLFVAFQLTLARQSLGQEQQAPSVAAADSADDAVDSGGTDSSGPNESALALQSFKTYCFDCHVGEGAEGGIRVDFLESFADPSSADAGRLFESNVEVIEKVILVLKEQQMPPADMDQPSSMERVAAIDWIEGRLQAFDCGSISSPGRVTIRRLNRVEYNNTIRDLTGLDLRLADDFPSDDVGNGFDNIGDVLTLPPILMEKYLDSAQAIASAVMQDEQARQRLFPYAAADEKNMEEVVDVARRNAEYFAGRAYRRPVTPEEAERLFALMRSAWEADATKEEILQSLITAVLASSHFLFRVEDDAEASFVEGVRRLNDYELASRLSYFLWSSMPDEALFEAARNGELHEPEQLTRQAQRMLMDPKAAALVQNFAGQWLQLRDLDVLSPDPALFNEFDAELRQAMRQETELLFSNIMTENRSVLELLDADYSFVNERLARHYGIEQVTGPEFRKVSLNGKRRGVLMHGSVLLLTSNPTRTSPVKRGKWVLDNLLAEPPPPPPPGVPELNEAAETLGTLRQRMEQHRADPNCAVCHTKMDALGFGLENFDAIGRWRDADGRDPIDPSGTLPGGKKFAGAVELVSILAQEKKSEFARCMANKMLTYALGRGLGVSDRCTVKSIVARLEHEDYRFHTLVESIVTSPPFMYQQSGQ